MYQNCIINLNKFEKALFENKNELYNDSIELFNKTISSCFEIMLLSTNSDYNNIIVFDQEICFRLMKSIVDNPKSGTLGLRIDDWAIFYQNEICFMNCSKIASCPMDVIDKANRDENLLLSNCMKKFFDDEINTVNFNKIIPCDFYQEINVFKNEVDKFMSIGCCYNINNIIKFYEELIKGIFSEFQFDSNNSSKNCKRYTKKFKDDIIIGFELDFKNSVSQMKRGNFYLPTFLNLFIVKVDTKGKFIKNTFMSLGIFGNPFFHPSSMSIKRYFLKSRDGEFEIENKKENAFYFKIIKKENTNGTVDIIFPEQEMDKVKRYSFFYYSLLYYSSKPYLKYVEKAILNSLLV